MLPRGLAAVVLAGLTLGACSSDSSSSGPAPQGAWGSSTASLTITDSTRHLLIAAGSCYGAYADINQAIPLGQLNLSGTFTQLTGSAPGFVTDSAQFTGTASSTNMSITITVPALGESLGPINLAYGVVTTLNACTYP